MTCGMEEMRAVNEMSSSIKINCLELFFWSFLTLIFNLFFSYCVNGEMSSNCMDYKGCTFGLDWCIGFLGRTLLLILGGLFDWLRVDWIRPFFGVFYQLIGQTFREVSLRQLQKLNEVHRLQLVDGIGGRFVLLAKKE